MSKPEVEAAVLALSQAVEGLYAALGDEVADAAVPPLALQFSRLNDDQQAKFFVEVARIMEGWGAGKSDTQAYYIGRHLATCECSTPEGRDFVCNIARVLAADLAGRYA